MESQYPSPAKKAAEAEIPVQSVALFNVVSSLGHGTRVEDGLRQDGLRV
jgi:hypothetical protein